MKPILLFLTLVSLTALIDSSHAAPTTAKVVLLRGKAMVLRTSSKKAVVLKQGDRIGQGETVATGEKSFLKLLYVDGTQMNLGPSSRIKIEQNSDRSKAGIVKLIGRKIRTKVSKDLLKRQERDNTKLFIQTKTAAMGVRGTDFDVIYNRTNGVTSLVTYEGIVAFARSTASEFARTVPREALSDSNTVIVQRGEYSGTVPKRATASLPVKISPVQFQALRQGSDRAGIDTPANVSNENQRLQNPLPPGVDARLLQADASRFESRIEAIVGPESIRDLKERVSIDREKDRPPPEGVNDGSSNYAPPAGGLVDLKTGIYVSPPPGSAFDKNAGVYIPPPTVGTVNPRTGEYTPPKGIELHPTKGFVASVNNKTNRGNRNSTDQRTDNPNDGALPPGTAPGEGGANDYYGGAEFAPPPTDLNFDVLGDGVVPPPGGFDGPGNFGLPPATDGPIDDPYCPDCDQQNPNQNNSGNEQNGITPKNTLIIRVNAT